jgi:hypothetical protein
MDGKYITVHGLIDGWTADKTFCKRSGKSSRLFAPIDGRLGLEDSTRTFDTVLSLVHFYSNYRYVLCFDNREMNMREQNIE